MIERSVETQERLLNAVNVELSAARERLRSLEAQYAREAGAGWPEEVTA